MKKLFPFIAVICLFNFGCQKESLSDVDGFNAYKFIVKGKITDTQGNPVADAGMDVVNNVVFNDNKKFKYAHSQTDKNGNYSITTFLEQGKENSAILDLQPTCNAFYYMKNDKVKMSVL